MLSIYSLSLFSNFSEFLIILRILCSIAASLLFILFEISYLHRPWVLTNSFSFSSSSLVQISSFFRICTISLSFGSRIYGLSKIFLILCVIAWKDLFISLASSFLDLPWIHINLIKLASSSLVQNFSDFWFILCITSVYSSLF